YILRYRKKLTGWTIREINNLPEAQAAQILRESAIFMSFGHPEGFGLPPAEAMACATIVIGYDGRGGAEYWPGHGIRIEKGGTLGYAQALERLLDEYDRDPTRLRQIAHDAGRFVRDTYSPEVERASIVDCWNQIMQ
ncbi:MAG TPA: glycosyltransferase, partial [Tepidisphaeraceae bacterium]|nr:glycosyltransferase [Tepidisphaeraceae bacterium]